MKVAIRYFSRGGNTKKLAMAKPDQKDLKAVAVFAKRVVNG